MNSIVFEKNVIRFLYNIHEYLYKNIKPIKAMYESVITNEIVCITTDNR